MWMEQWLAQEGIESMVVVDKLRDIAGYDWPILFDIYRQLALSKVWLCALCFVLCALCFVLCALCFVLCALCFGAVLPRI